TWLAPTMEFSSAAHVLGTPGHSWQVVAQSGMGIGHRSLIFSAKTLSASILDLLTKPELLSRAKDELKGRLGGQVYRSALTPGSKPPLDMWEKTS
ncbi:amidohydrolase, partial [miscellaneous Crenarchaeota group-15 archaeon DG-45]